MLSRTGFNQLGKYNSKVSPSLRRTKIEYTTGNSYNQRWQWKWKHAYYGSPRENDHTQVNKPEDTNVTAPMWGTWINDFTNRTMPALNTAYARRHRMYDNVSLYGLLGLSGLNALCYDLNFGFKVLTFVPLAVLYTRIRDKTMDPDLKETHLREMMYNNEEISELFNEETIHVLDYDMEYDTEIPSAEEFPEYENKIWNHFNTDTGMTTGHFSFGDLESGATMTLKFNTMPIPGDFRYQVGEPFFIFDCVAEITHNGVYKEVVLVDRAESLSRYRPYLFLY